jgi:hypothetical protein
MTQQMQREVVVLIPAIAVLVRSIFPKPIIEGATKKPYENQWIIRLSFAAFGLFGVGVWFCIYREGR